MKGKSRVALVGAVFVWVTIILTCTTYGGRAVESAGYTDQSCLSKPEIVLALRDLSSRQDWPQLEALRVRLLDNAKLSANCRGQIIDGIIEAMDKPQLDAYQDFHLWRYGSRLLGDLKATEGLDLLIKNLSFTDGASINPSRYPAMQGVIKIGQPAIRKLGAALRENSNITYRYNAVFCIAQIGGPAATKELKAALPSESDSCLQKFIQISIKALSNPKSPGQIGPEDRDAWFAALSCKQ